MRILATLLLLGLTLTFCTQPEVTTEDSELTHKNLQRILKHTYWKFAWEKAIDPERTGHYEVKVAKLQKLTEEFIASKAQSTNEFNERKQELIDYINSLYSNRLPHSVQKASDVTYLVDTLNHESELQLVTSNSYTAAILTTINLMQESSFDAYYFDTTYFYQREVQLNGNKVIQLLPVPISNTQYSKLILGNDTMYLAQDSIFLDEEQVKQFKTFKYHKHSKGGNMKYIKGEIK